MVALNTSIEQMQVAMNENTSVQNVVASGCGSRRRN